MTELFRFRSMEYLLGDKYQELEKQTIYFASPDELNDPIEGFRDIVWKGDEVVWTNFIKHYIFSLLVSYFLYSITKESEEFDVDKIPIPDQWDLPPNPHLQRLFDEIWHRFLNLPKMSEIFETLANTNRKIRYTELELLFNVIQSIFIVQNRELYFQHGIISESEMQQLMEEFPTAQKLSELILTSLIELEETETDEQNRDMFQIIEARRNSDRIIHLLNYPDFSVQLQKNALLMMLDFPRKYLNEVERLLWPKWYTACFMKSYHNSSVWGHYGDKHRGACLIFESEKTGSSNSLELHQATDDSVRKMQFHEISYRDKPSEVEFFRSIGKLPVKVLMRLWYTDENNNISEYAPPSDDIDTWRKNYWDNFYRSIAIKSKDWEYEQEHRLILKDSLNKFEEKFKEKKNRTLTYNFHSLKGIIFGIKTSDEDKLRIIDIIRRKRKKNNRTDFKFFQAYYSPQDGDIRKFEIQLSFADAIELNPNDAEAYNNRGGAYIKKGDYDRAIEDCTKAIQLNPSYAGAYNNRGVAYRYKGDFNRALEDCTKAIDLNPSYAGAYNNRGTVYGETGDYNRAIKDHTKAIQLEPNDADAYNNRGVAYRYKGDFNRALEDCTKAIDLNPSYAGAYNNRGIAYSDKGDYNCAIKDYTKAIGLNPNYAEAYYNRGKVYSEQNDFDRAIADYTKAIDLNPNYAEAYNNRGIAYNDKGDFNRALEDYTKAIDLNPNHVDAYYNRGEVYSEQNDFDRAIGDFTTVINLNPNDVPAYSNRGAAYGEKGDFDRAIKDFNKMIELNPNDANAYNNRGVAYYSMDKYNRAVEDYTKAIDLNPDYVEAYSNRGGAYVNKDEIDRALEDCTKAIDLNPDYADAYSNRGGAYVNKGDYDRAIEDCTKAIHLNPNCVNAYNNRGGAYVNKGDYDRAIEDYIKAMELNPDYVEAYYNRGNIYGEQGDFDRAIDDYTKAIELNPDYVEAYKNRGLAYSGKSDYSRAIEDYTRAIELKPDLTEVYVGRGVAWLHLKEWEKVRTDLMAARNMGVDIIAVFHYFYKSVEDFERKNGVKLPADLAAMLTPQEVVTGEEAEQEATHESGSDFEIVLDDIVRKYDRAWKILAKP